MKTVHSIYYSSSEHMEAVRPRSVDLVVTSPPYPMITMWDDMFSLQDREIAEALAAGQGMDAFERMHRILDRVWEETVRVLKPGGIACINIGDAVRTVKEDFRLYPNHARIMSRMTALGLSPLPFILWRKQTNAPNKFMGSGMLPPGAYVTLEHEYILIFRKGGKREFRTESERKRRRESAFFREERNHWFSDVWTDLKGTGQRLGIRARRDRSAAYPFDLPYRLISMFSVYGDTVLDPFAGTGTTILAAITAGRSSIGFESDAGFRGVIPERTAGIEPFARKVIRHRLDTHRFFVEERKKDRKPPGYRNVFYGFPVMTRQEIYLKLAVPGQVVVRNPGLIEAVHLFPSERP